MTNRITLSAKPVDTGAQLGQLRHPGCRHARYRRRFGGAAQHRHYPSRLQLIKPVVNVIILAVQMTVKAAAVADGGPHAEDQTT